MINKRPATKEEEISYNKVLGVIQEAIDFLSAEQEKVRCLMENTGLYKEEVELLELMTENNTEKITGKLVSRVKLTLIRRDEK